jgi:alanyl-tRNA synthetase
MEKEIASARSAKAMDSVMDLVKKAQKVKDFTLVIDKLDDEISVDDLRAIAVNLKTKVESSIIVLATLNSGKPLLVAAVSANAINLGIKAGELIKIGSTVLGGGGGGKDDFAQGGGIDSNSIPKAFSEISKAIMEKIN